MPIGSMYAIYMVTFTINIPHMLAYIPYMDPMGCKTKHWGYFHTLIFCHKCECIWSCQQNCLEGINDCPCKTKDWPCKYLPIYPLSDGFICSASCLGDPRSQKPCPWDTNCWSPRYRNGCPLDRCQCQISVGSTKKGIPIGEFLLMVDVCSLGTIDFLHSLNMGNRPVL